MLSSCNCTHAIKSVWKCDRVLKNPEWFHSEPTHVFSHASKTCRRFSLMVMRIPTLVSLGLRSLREISDGSVYISQNARLCYHHTVNWTQLFRGRRVRANSLNNNRPPAECGKAAGQKQNLLSLMVSRKATLKCKQDRSAEALQKQTFLLNAALCVQLRRATCVTHCAPTRDAGVRGLTSVSPAGTTAGTVFVWAAVISTQGQ